MNITKFLKKLNPDDLHEWVVLDLVHELKDIEMAGKDIIVTFIRFIRKLEDLEERFDLNLMEELAEEFGISSENLKEARSLLKKNRQIPENLRAIAAETGFRMSLEKLQILPNIIYRGELNGNNGE